MTALAFLNLLICGFSVFIATVQQLPAIKAEQENKRAAENLLRMIWFSVALGALAICLSH